MNGTKICCVTGERPEGFPWDYYDEADESQKEYRSALEGVVERYIKEGYRYFINGGAKGADEDIAALLAEYRKTYPDIRLEVVRPYRAMVKEADILVAVWHAKRKGSTYRAIRYAESLRKPVDFVYLPACISAYGETEALLRLLSKNI